MNNKIKFIAVFLLFLVTQNLLAIETYQTQEEARKYDKDMCIATHSNQCLSETCLTSEDIDCSEQCRQEAEAKCSSDHRSYHQDSHRQQNIMQGIDA